MENKKPKMVGCRDLNSGPPAPKPAGLSFGSPSFSILFLQINEIEEYLVVAWCTEMWLRMRRVPPISPSTKKQRNAFIDARLLRNTNPSVESRKGAGLFRLNMVRLLWCCRGN